LAGSDSTFASVAISSSHYVKQQGRDRVAKTRIDTSGVLQRSGSLAIRIARNYVQ
jgi:hypothetical protein